MDSAGIGYRRITQQTQLFSNNQLLELTVIHVGELGIRWRPIFTSRISQGFAIVNTSFLGLSFVQVAQTQRAISYGILAWDRRPDLWGK